MTKLYDISGPRGLGDALNDEFAGRLRALQLRLGLRTQEEFGDLIGVKQQIVSKWFRGGSLPAAENLVQIARGTGCSIDWLLLGERGAPEGEEAPFDLAAERGAGYAATRRLAAGEPPPAGFTAPPWLSPLTGEPDDAPPAPTLAFADPWLRALGDPTSMALFPVSGESMAPTLRDRDIVLADRAQRQPRHDGIFLVSLAGGILAKRVELRPGIVRLLSEHSLREPIDCDPGILPPLVGRVVWLGRSLT